MTLQRFPVKLVHSVTKVLDTLGMAERSNERADVSVKAVESSLRSPRTGMLSEGLENTAAGSAVLRRQRRLPCVCPGLEGNVTNHHHVPAFERGNQTLFGVGKLLRFMAGRVRKVRPRGLQRVVAHQLVWLGPEPKTSPHGQAGAVQIVRSPGGRAHRRKPPPCRHA
jgi:hypothetical protein